MSKFIPDHPIARQGSARYGSSPEALVGLFARLQECFVEEEFDYECHNTFPNDSVRKNLFTESDRDIRRWDIGTYITAKTVTYDSDIHATPIDVIKTDTKTIRGTTNYSDMFTTISLETNVGMRKILVIVDSDSGNFNVIFDNDTFKSAVITFIFFRPKNKDDK